MIAGVLRFPSKGPSNTTLEAVATDDAAAAAAARAMPSCHNIHPMQLRSAVQLNNNAVGLMHPH
jgi:hypothetical protein